MAIDMNKAINKMKSLKSKGITYSMYGSRTGTDGTADCSGAVYAALRAGGGSNFGYVPSTETLHDYLKQNGFELVAQNKGWNGKKGDVIIWGRRGQSAGAGGHTGILTGGANWIECTAYRGGGNGSRGGIITANHDSRWAMNGRPYYYAYRKKKASKPKKKKVKVPKKSYSTKKFDHGAKVKITSKASKYQTGQKIPASVKKGTYTIKERQTVNQSKSKYAFLLKELNSWVLSQDLTKAPKKKAPKKNISAKQVPGTFEVLRDLKVYNKPGATKANESWSMLKKGSRIHAKKLVKTKSGNARLKLGSGYILGYTNAVKRVTKNPNK